VKILILSHMYPRPGHEHYGVFVHESVLALAERGHEVTVVAPLPMTPPGLAFLRPAWRTLAAIPALRELDGIVIHHPRYLLLPRRIGFAGAAVRMARAAMMAMPSLSEKRFDLLHAHAGVPDGAAARRIAGRLKIPYVVTSHGSDVLRASRWSPAVHAELERAFRDATAVLFPSSRAMARAEEIGLRTDHGEVVWNGYRDDIFTPPGLGGERPDRPLRVICVANLVPSKGVDLLLDAMAACEAPTSLRLVGDGPERGALLERAKRLGVALHWDRRLDRGDLADALRAADCFALPAGGESFGIVYLEAMACGLPVIAPAGEGIADVLRHEIEGLLLPERSDVELAAAIERLAGDGELRASLGSAALARARELSWSRHAVELERVYTAVADASGGTS